ncbi:MAG TPA: tetratricopeptide repeat protein, partial [Vicinamibacteria bacterium]|nr:tetratricopeptide repeat protein [Vicinamibacteria bacterium]
AQAYFEKAVKADPGFAMALTKLSIVHGNRGEADKAREYSARAVEKAGALPPGERYYIEGRHHSLDPASIEKAVAAYQKAVDAAPDNTAARNNLAQALFELRRYPEALVHLEELRRRGMTFPGSYMSLADAYLATGRPEAGLEALKAYVAKHPDRPAGHENLAFFELTQGRVDEALAELERAAALGPEDRSNVALGRFVAHALRDDWAGAEAAVRGLYHSKDPRERWRGGSSLACASLFRGDLGRARRLAEEGAKAGRNAEERFEARLFRIRMEADLGHDREALLEADRALAEKVPDPKLVAEGQAMRAISLARLGRSDEASKSANEVRSVLGRLPAAMSLPLQTQLEGELALARGDRARARELLTKAAELSRPDSMKMEPRPLQVQYTLARAALADGDDEKARAALTQVVETGPARIASPILYVRSLALLASLEEKAGHAAAARGLYERYLAHWKDGQIDRAEVARAGQRLAALRARPAA